MSLVDIGGGGGAVASPIVSIGPNFGNPPELEVGCDVNLTTIGVTPNAQSVGCQFRMPSVSMAFNAQSVGCHLAGTALGTAYWRSVGVVASTTNGTSVVIPKPADLAVGDLMLAFVSSDGLTTTTLSTGFTLILNTQRDGTLDCTLNSSWKIADAGDVAASNFTFTISASNGFTGCIHRIDSADPTTPINVSAAGTGSAADPVALTATTTADNCLVFVACVQRQTLDESFTAPANYTERTDQTGLGSAGVHVIDTSTASKPQATAGATGAQTFNSTAALGQDYAAQTVAIKPTSFTLAA